MDDPTKLPPPVIPTGDVSTHLSYMRRDMDETKINAAKSFDKLDRSIADINSKLDRLTDGYVTRIDFDEHLKADADHEARIRILETASSDLATIKRLVYGCVGLLLTLLISAVVYLVIK